MWQGTPMTFEGAAKATTLEGQEQTIARGVTAGVVSIKQLGTNGGATSAELATLREPDAALELRRDLVDHHHPDGDGGGCSAMVRPAQAGGRDLRDDAGDLHLPMVVFGVAQEAGGNPAISRDGRGSVTGSMEGKEVRFGAGCPRSGR